MRVVLTAYGTSGYSGLPKYFYFLARHLALNGLDVEVIVDSQDRANKMKEVTTQARAKVIGPAVTGIVSKALFPLNVANYLKNAEFDVLHSCDVIPYFYLQQERRKPVVFQPFSSEMFQLGSRDIRRLLYFVLRSCGQKADALAVVGEWQWEDTLRDYKVAKDKTFVLPVGIDIDFITGTAKPRREARELLGIPQDAYIVLSVNILLACKGINYLIQSMLNVPDATLIIVSAGPEEDNLKELASDLCLQDQILFVGKVPEKDLYNYYAAADVFVSPTLLNGSSMGIMEAEAFGLPIVSTHQEFLIDGNGYVVPEKNPEAIAVAVNQVREDDRVKMGARSREIVQQYDFKRIAKTAIVKYKELVR
jgi:glycosyltransferase involved in cell wall biosynthesis